MHACVFACISMDDKIQQFVSITGSDIEVARSLLEACSGDVNMAVSMHLDSKGIPSAERVIRDDSKTVSGCTESADSRTYEEIHGVRAPIPQTQGVLIEQEAPRRTFRRRNLPASVFDPFQDYSSSSHSAAPINDKKQTLSNLFRPPVDLMFHGDFSEARIAGQSSNKWLLVNLQDSTEFSCQVLNRDLWSNEKVKKVIRNNFIFWQIQRITDEGIRFRQLYHVENYPAIIIIDPRTGEKMEHWNHLTLDEFLSKVAEFHSINKLDETNATTKLSAVYDTSEDAQLEAAIKASLEDPKDQHIIITNSDSESDLLSPIVSDDTDNSEVEMHIESSNNVKTMQAIKPRPDNVVDLTDSPVTAISHRKRPGSNVYNEDEFFFRSKNPKLESPDDPTSSMNKSGLSDDLESVQIGDDYNSKSKRTCTSRTKSKETTTNGSKSTQTKVGSDKVPGECCQVLIRFPDGRRTVKTFLADDTIKELFDYLKQEGFLLSDYEITTTFPHTVISSLPSSTTFKNAGLCPRQTVHVQQSD